MTQWATQLVVMFFLTGVGTIVSAQEQLQEQGQFFEKEIRPLLAEHCFECHSGAAQKGNLQLDSLAGMLSGGDSGPAVVPGHPEDSLLISAVKHESFEMPPSGQLPDSSIEKLTTWVQLGAHWPGSDPSTPLRKRSSQEFTDEDRAWWAIQPFADVTPPAIPNQDWARNEIDLYILQEMQAQGLQPAPEADRVTLIRRLYFDLLGLPPRPEEIRAFVESTDPHAWEKLVDELLNRPQYGERWARHWLDLVRYADSDGYRIDHYRPSAWRYRDYVIDSLNADKPYSRFAQEQLAGDEMFPEDADAQTATGYLRHWIYEYNNRDARGQWDIIVNEVTDTTSDVFLGLGLQCARCHDHKFDPILQKDYYRLRACFEAIYPDDRVVAGSESLKTYHDQLAQWENATTELRAQLQQMQLPVQDMARNEAVSRFPADIQALIAKPDAERTPQEQQIVALAWRQVLYEYERLDDRFKNDKKEQLLAVRRELAKFDHIKPAVLPVTMAIRDVGPQAPLTVIPRKKTEVEPGIPELLANQVPFSVSPLPNSTGRRTALARWITSPENALTHRVMVNRIWQYHFGRGLAANGSDFGRLGGPPTHPQLLDWLAQRFITENTQLKPLHRLILNSATWRQAAHHPQLDAYQQIDPANRFYWRTNTRRLDAEQIRDAILAASGRLDLSVGGEGQMSDSSRRSIYLRFMRNERDSLLDVFDLPLFFNSSSSRDSTTSPVQALMLFNSETMLRHASSLAKRVANDVEVHADLEHGPLNKEARIRRLWDIAYGKQPDSHELHETQNFLAQQAERIAGEQKQILGNAVPIGRIPYRDGQSILIQPDLKTPPLLVPKPLPMESGSLTVEVFFQIRSVYDTAAVRTLLSRWNGDAKTPGWTFGITGKDSRRQPQTLVLQMFGQNAEGKLVEAALFSDQHIELNKPYYAAVTFEPARSGSTPITGASGTVPITGTAAESSVGRATFYLKDLSNADEPLLSAQVEHEITGGFENELPLSVGSKASSEETSFDGLIDDVRLSASALSPTELVYTREGLHPTTVGYWRFETNPGILKDSSGNSLDLAPALGERILLSPTEAAFEDLCHTVLNSSRFLYVD